MMKTVVVAALATRKNDGLNEDSSDVIILECCIRSSTAVGI